jgi:VanZ family protein
MKRLRWLRPWLPALCWAAVIWSFSTDTFSAQHTGRILEPLLRWIFPGIRREHVRAIHFLVRKSGHFIEYFVFGLLLYRGLRGEEKGWLWEWAGMALSLAAGYAVLDEVHQSFVASRTASGWDSLLDSAGALAAMMCCWAWYRWRDSRQG